MHLFRFQSAILLLILNFDFFVIKLILFFWVGGFILFCLVYGFIGVGGVWGLYGSPHCHKLLLAQAAASIQELLHFSIYSRRLLHFFSSSFYFSIR
jgi:hypothetical protein